MDASELDTLLEDVSLQMGKGRIKSAFRLNDKRLICRRYGIEK